MACLRLGELIGETNKFYIYRSQWGDEKRIKKGGARRSHIKPCIFCTDHPETVFPPGWQYETLSDLARMAREKTGLFRHR
jgi:hypothetical protein